MFVTSAECINCWNVLKLQFFCLFVLTKVLSVTFCHLRCWLGLLLPSPCISHEEEYGDLGGHLRWMFTNSHYLFSSIFLFLSVFKAHWAVLYHTVIWPHLMFVFLMSLYCRMSSLCDGNDLLHLNKNSMWLQFKSVCPNKGKCI